MISKLRDTLKLFAFNMKRNKEIAKLKAEVARLNLMLSKSECKLTDSVFESSDLKYRNDLGYTHNKVLIKEIARLKDELDRERFIYSRALASVSEGERIYIAVMNAQANYDRTNS